MINQPDFRCRIEFRFRGEEEVSQLLNSFGYGSLAFREKVVEKKDKIIRFVHLSPSRTLENKRKEKKTAFFWLEFSEWLTDNTKILSIDQGEGLEDLPLLSNYRKIQKLEGKMLENLPSN